MDQIGFTPTDKLLMIFVTAMFAVDFVVFVSANQRPVKPTN